MVITIDGPAGAGKSSVARRLAARLGAAFLDTGAFYRAATLAVLQQGPAEPNLADVAAIVRQARIEMEGTNILLDGRNVTVEIRTPEVTRSIKTVADNSAARQELSARQREFAKACGAEGEAWLVTEGRDQGTEVFPDARCKIFLTASPEERARRRQSQLFAAGCDVPFEQVLADQTNRDEEDRTRPVGALRIADDALVFYTDGLSEDEVVDQLVDWVRQALDPS
jgi:cytidylate kinase/pantoate ligase/cytidylate kinase